jgi:hypothetical protein
VTITDNASNSPQSISVKGTGISPVTLSAYNRVFMSRFVGQTSGIQYVNVTNGLNRQLQFSSIATSGDFAVASNTCGSSLGAGLVCTIGVNFTPTALGLRQGTLTISYNAFGSPSLVALSGTGNDNGLTSISVTPANFSIVVANSQQYAATGFLSGGGTQNLTPFVAWSSAALGVATISAGGLATGVTTGSSSISATLGGITGSTTLTVTASPPVLVSIAATPANSSITIGGTQQFTATGTYSDGSQQNLSTATWSSSAPGVATISAGGLATGGTPGSSSITATVGSISGSTNLTVNSSSPAPAWLEFMGDGSEGDYSCTSGTCTLGGEHWVTSFDVSAGATVVTSGINTPLVIRSTGACTIAGTVSNSPNSGAGVTITGGGDFGGSGGGGGGGTAAGQGGLATLADGGLPVNNGGAAGAALGGAGGNANSGVPGQYRTLLNGGTFFPIGGAVGGQGGSNGGAGGWGGGAIILVCNSIDLSGTIDVSGGTGGASPGNNSGAGGGGGAGYVILSAVSYSAITGTIDTAGGAGGSCNSNTGCGAGGNGGSGWSVALMIP